MLVALIDPWIPIIEDIGPNAWSPVSLDLFFLSGRIDFVGKTPEHSVLLNIVYLRKFYQGGYL